MTRLAARRPAVCAALLTFIAGCSTVAGQPTAQPALWDPCTIPSDAIAAAGVDPTILTDQLMVQTDEWDICTFRQDWFFLSIQVTKTSLDNVRANADQSGLIDEEVDGRATIRYRRTGVVSSDRCNVAFATAVGTLIVTVDTAGSATRQDDSCGKARELTLALSPYLPD